MKFNIDEDTLELFERFDLSEKSLETLINVLLIEGFEKLVKDNILKVDEKDKTKILIKLLSLKINIIPRVEEMLKKQVRRKNNEHNNR